MQCPNYRILTFISGKVYSGQQTNSHINVEVVIKIAKSSEDSAALIHEYQVFQHLGSGCGIPKALWLGREGEHHVMVLECFGSSLGDCFQSCGQKFTLNTVTLIALQLVS